MVEFQLPLAALGNMSEAQRRKLLQRLLREVKAATPVKTGQLRDGWYLDGDILRNDVPYAEYVNDGTPKMAPRDMTGRALAALGML